MFDFEKLQVYNKAKEFNLQSRSFIKGQKSLDITIKNQLRRSSLSIMLNIAEGSGRYSKADKRHFYVIARGSCFESVAIFDCLSLEGAITKELYGSYYFDLEEISKMLFSMIKKLE